jgi:hypothetical protein
MNTRPDEISKRETGWRVDEDALDELLSGSEEGSYLRLIDFYIAQL